jgi:hypothetical protein
MNCHPLPRLYCRVIAWNLSFKISAPGCSEGSLVEINKQTMENNLQLTFAAWFELYKNDLPEPLKKIMGNHYETLRFVYDDYMRGMKIMSEALHELIREQYPAHASVPQDHYCE